MFSCKILIVDDDTDDRDILIHTFQQIGVEGVRGVTSAEAAIAFLKDIDDDQALPRLIITDLNMPCMSGQEFLRTLKEMSRYQHIPIIVCSTSTSLHEIDNCLSTGAKDYVVKPSSMKGYVHVTQQLSTLANSL